MFCAVLFANTAHCWRPVQIPRLRTAIEGELYGLFRTDADEATTFDRLTHSLSSCRYVSVKQWQCLPV
jgi:hypothetical protein